MNNEIKEVNNLKKFGTGFQTKCVAILVSDRSFLERICEILSPDHFELDGHKWIVKKSLEYFTKFKELPTMEVFKQEIKSIQDPALSAAVFEQIKFAYKEVGAKDSGYIKEAFLDFCKNQKLVNAIYESIDFVKRGDYDSIKNSIDNALKAGMERNLGHDYLSEIDKRMSDSVRHTIPTNWDIIDSHMDGGLGKGELGFVVAPAGSGKSWLLARLGAEAMKMGKNVIHFTMELNEEYVGRRYDAYFSGFAFQEVTKNTDQIKNIIKNIAGKLQIKFFPIKTASPNTLKMYIERYQLITGIKVDLVIVDYADLLKPFASERNSNSYNEAGSVYEELRGILGELQIPGWSASQSNRSAHEEEIIEAHNVADSYRKIMTGDFIMSLSRKMEDKIAGTGRLHIMKNRFGSDGITYPCEFNTSCGRINIYDQKSAEGMEILRKSANEQENLKRILRKKFKDQENGDSNN